MLYLVTGKRKRIRDEASSKSSLKYLDIKKLKLEKNLLWTNAGFETTAIAKAAVKCRLLLWVYTLQANRHKFSQYEVDPTCPLCNLGPEDRTHFLVTCQRLQTHRLEFFDQMETILQEMSHGISSILMKDPATLTQII